MKQIFLLLLVLPALASAQDSLSFEAPVNPRPVVMRQSPVIKIAPLSLIDLDATIQAAVEIPLRQRLSIQQEIGVGWPRLGLANYQKELTTAQKNTLRSRTEIRYYFSPELLRKGLEKSSTNGFYAAGEVLVKRMNVKGWRNAASTQRHIYGLHAKIGYQGVLSSKHPQFVVDVYVGAGFRVVSVRQVSGSPVGPNNFVHNTGLFAYNEPRSRFDPIDRLLHKPSMAAGVKLGWMINSGQKVKRK
ncbi:MAG: DUF3575 domain-containing protein [Cytophagales bacterium]|nr:MAG: DUF3575 domain-containing protein [Cytophagales bacterium]